MNMRFLILCFFVTVECFTLCFAGGKTALSDNASEFTESQLQSREEMKALTGLLSMVRDFDGLATELTREQKAEIGKRSLRAWNLDPTHEMAAYYACMFYCWTFPPDGEAWESHGAEAKEQTVLLIRKYREQFKDSNPSHLKILELLRWNYATSSREKLDAEAEIVFWSLKDTSVINNSSQRNFLGSLCHHIKKVELSEIQAEYDYWIKVFHEKLLPIWEEARKTGHVKKQFYYSWEMVEAYYYARLKNSQKVIEVLQSAADKYSIEDDSVWQKYYGSMFGIEDILEILGDRKYKTWRPKFHSDKSKAKGQMIEKDFYEKLEAFCKRTNSKDLIDIKPRFAEPVELELVNIKLPQIHTSAHVSSDGTILKFPVQPLGIINEKYWLYISPLSCSLDNLKFDHHLAIGGNLESATSDIEFSELHWPEYPIPKMRVKQDTLRKTHLFHVTSYYIENGNNNEEFTLWMGTRYHGLAMFRHAKDGSINSRWFTAHEGLPEIASIEEIFPAKYKGAHGLLMHLKYDVWKYYYGQGQLVFLDLQRNRFILIKDNLDSCFSINFEKHKVRFPSCQFERGIFSSNRNLCQWADAMKTQLEYMKIGDLSDANIINDSFRPTYSLGIADVNNTGSIFVEPRKTFYFDTNFQLKKCFDTIRMPDIPDTDTRFGMVLPQFPTLDIGHIYTCSFFNGYVILISQRVKDSLTVQGIGEKHLFIWKPGNHEPFLSDQWYGPFSLGTLSEISSIFPGDEKYVWLISPNYNSGLYRLDINKAIAAAESNNAVSSTSEMIDVYVEATHLYWRLNIIALIGAEKKDEAFGILDRIIETNKLNPNIDYFDAIAIKAIIYSHTRKDYLKAIALYEMLLSKTQSPEYQYIAKVNMGHLYRKMQKHAETIKYLSEAQEYIDILERLCPQTPYESHIVGKFMNHHNQWHIEQAKQGLAKLKNKKENN